MCKKIIIVAGYLAGGKTIFSQKLSEKIKIPCFNKDLMKIELGKNIEVNNREDSKRLSIATYNIMMHIMENFMKAGKPLIIESNFDNYSSKIIKQYLEKYGYKPLTYLLLGDLKILHKRFIERENSSERDNVNKIFGLLNDFLVFEKSVEPLKDFNVGGEIIRIDTSYFNKVNFDKYIEDAYNFINK